MLAISLSQPWATLVADRRKAVILLDEDPEPYRKLYRAEVALHATDVWDGSAWNVIRRFMRPDALERYEQSPEIVYPMNAVICRCLDVSFRDSYDDVCVGGALEPIRGRTGLTVRGGTVKFDYPVPSDGGDYLWQWDGKPVISDASGQVMLF